MAVVIMTAAKVIIGDIKQKQSPPREEVGERLGWWVR